MNIITSAKLFYDAGFRGTGLITAIAIAIAESDLDPLAVGDVSLQTDKWGPSIGLFQIRSLKPAYLYMEPVRDATKLTDAAYNARAAFIISKKGTNFGPWSTFTQNIYTQHIAAASEAVKAIETVVATASNNSTGLIAAAIIGFIILKNI